MKNVFYLAAVILLSTLISGCFSSKEEIWINPDGSGKMETVSDMSDMYPLMAIGMAAEKEKIKNGEATDSNPFTDMMMEEEIDTVYHMGDIMAEAMDEEGMTWDQMLDSIRYAPVKEGDEEMTLEDRETMAQMFEDMKDMKMRWQVSEKNQIMKSTVIHDFISIDELKDKAGGMMEMMKKLGELGGDKDDKSDQEMIGMFDKMGSAVTTLSLSGNSLNIKRKGIDLSSLDEDTGQMMNMMKMFLKDNYQIIVHFPGKVKKVNSDLVEVIDKNSIKIEFPLERMFDPQLNIDVDVQFKGLKK